MRRAIRKSISNVFKDKEPTGFGGTEDDDVLGFIRSIDMHAISHPEVTSDRLAKLAVVRLEGEAMEWFAVQLDPVTQNDWPSLRRALVRKYSPSESQEAGYATPLPPPLILGASREPSPPRTSAPPAPKPTLAPAPAPAAMGNSDWDRSMRGRNVRRYPSLELEGRLTTTGVWRGYIMVIDSASRRFLGYVSRSPRAELSLSKEYSLVVEAPSYSEEMPFHLRMSVSGKPSISQDA